MRFLKVVFFPSRIMLNEQAIETFFISLAIVSSTQPKEIGYQNIVCCLNN